MPCELLWDSHKWDSSAHLLTKICTGWVLVGWRVCLVEAHGIWCAVSGLIVSEPLLGAQLVREHVLVCSPMRVKGNPPHTPQQSVTRQGS